MGEVTREFIEQSLRTHAGPMVETADPIKFAAGMEGLLNTAKGNAIALSDGPMTGPNVPSSGKGMGRG